MNQIEKISQNTRFSRIRRKIVQSKFFLQRAHSWVSSPSAILVVLGVWAPYVQGYFNVSILVLALITLAGLLVIGLMDHLFGFSKAEISFGQEQNILLLSKIEEINKKVDGILERKNEK